MRSPARMARYSANTLLTYLLWSACRGPAGPHREFFSNRGWVCSWRGVRRALSFVLVGGLSYKTIELKAARFGMCTGRPPPRRSAGILTLCATRRQGSICFVKPNVHCQRDGFQNACNSC